MRRARQTPPRGAFRAACRAGAARRGPERAAAARVASRSLAGFGDPAALFVAALSVPTAVLGRPVSDRATALIVIPIAASAAGRMGVCIAAAAFLTPVATPADLTVMEPAGCRLQDYWKRGLPHMLWFFAAAAFPAPLPGPF